jgi:predicted DNA-binding transcriptional regulator AlpA
MLNPYSDLSRREHRPARFLESSYSQYWSSGQVREYFGGVSAMWIRRRLNDPASDFPKPVKLGSARNYWRIEKIIGWRTGLDRGRHEGT